MTATAAQQQRPSSRLGSVLRGPQHHALRYLFYGPEGVGKSTLAAGAVKPIIFDLEGGADQLDVTRYVFRDDDQGHVPRTLAEVYAGIADLRAADHEYETLILDTVGSLETLVWDRVCEKYSGSKSQVNQGGKTIDSIEGFGFGKGYVCAVDELRTVLAALEQLRLEKKMTIILLGHSMIKAYKNPAADDYDRIQLRMHDKAAGLLKQWCDVVGYCAFEETVESLGESRPKGFSTGRRMVHLKRESAWDAKTRIALPDVIEMEPGNSWVPFAKAVAAGQSLTADDIERLIKAELKRIGDDDITTKVVAACKAAKGQTSILSQYLQDLKPRKAKEAN